MGTGCGRIESRVELKLWAERELGLKVAGEKVCSHHQAPLDYLWEAYRGEGDVVVWAPRGGGKTRLGAAATLLDLLHRPGCAVRILGGSLEQSLRMWEHLVPDLGRVVEESKIVEDKALKIVLENGASAALLPQSQKAVRGLHVQRLRCDEVDEFDARVWSAAQLIIKSREGTRGTVEAMSTMHKRWGVMSTVIDEAQERGKKVIKWCVLEVLEKCDEDRVCEACPLYAECGGSAKRKTQGGYLSVEDAIALKRRVSRETWECEMLCMRASTEGAVFPHFNVGVHVRQEMEMQGSELWLGVDFGFSNPFVALFIRVDEKGRVLVEDEYVRSGTMMHEHVDEIRRRATGSIVGIGCDPAGNGKNDQTAKSNVEVLRQAGWNVHSMGSQIADGLEVIRQALAPGAGEPTLFIRPNCRELIKAMQGYRFEAGTEVPVKDGHDHLVDALRYFYVNRKRWGARGRLY